MMHVLLGLGANLGDPLAQLAAAVDALEEVMTVDAVSSVYRTAPVGYADQPDFLNLAVAGTTTRTADDLLAALHDIEARTGRTRTIPNGPRTLDLDLLAYGAEIVRSPGLVLPHPRLHERAFVLHPLAEIAPDWKHPLLRKTARELLSGGAAQGRVERTGPLPRHPARPLAPRGDSG